MPDMTYIGCCGVDCSQCPDLASGKCAGCRQSIQNGFDDCNAIKCCKEKSISSCGECTVFPCADMKEFFSESESHAKAYELLKEIHNEK